MKRPTLILMTAAVALASVWVWFDRGSAQSEDEARKSREFAAHPQESGGPRLKAGTRKNVGEFDLRKGRKIRISTADTIQGMECLIEEDAGAATSSCLESGLFALRKAEFLVGSEGGPEQFSDLHLVGIAAPDVRDVSLVKTDGSTVSLRLNSQRAFLYESPASDLESRIYPTALRLYGPSGKLVDTVTFPGGS